MSSDNKQQSSTPTDDPVLSRLFARMPHEIANSFSDEQRTHLKVALGARSWGVHSVDWRTTVALPFLPWRFYVVFLCGRNRRQLRDGEKHLSAWAVSVIMLLLAAACTTAGLVLIYLAKSALGIDLIPGFSLGLWEN